MKTASILILVLAIFFTAFGAWGVFTSAGSKMFVEMNGLIPFGMLVAGIVLLIASFVLMAVMRIKKLRARGK